MTRYFSEDASKRIAKAVRWYEQEGTTLELDKNEPVIPGRPPRFYKTPEIDNDQIPSTASLFPLECTLMKITSTTDGNFEFSETKIVEEVLFDYIPEANVVVQATNFNGRPCAFSQQLKIMPVQLVKSSGEAGDLNTKCSFKYDIYN